MLNQQNESTQEPSKTSESDTDFNAMIWANSLLGSGNTAYQNEFYANQARKLSEKFANGIG